MKTKRIIALFLTVIFVFAFSACASEAEKEVGTLFFEDSELQISNTLKNAFQLQSELSTQAFNKFNKFDAAIDLDKLEVSGISIINAPVTLGGQILLGETANNGSFEMKSGDLTLGGSLYWDDENSGLMINGITEKHIPLEFFTQGFTNITVGAATVDYSKYAGILDEVLALLNNSLASYEVVAGTKEITINNKNINARTGKMTILGDDFVELLDTINNKINSNAMLGDLFMDLFGIDISNIDITENADVGENDGIVVTKFYDKNTFIGFTLEAFAEDNGSLLLKVFTYNDYLSVDLIANEYDEELINCSFVINASRTGFESTLDFEAMGTKISLEIAADVAKIAGKQVITLTFDCAIGELESGGMELSGSLEVTINSYTDEKIDVELSLALETKTAIPYAEEMSTFSIEAGIKFAAEQSGETPQKPADYAEYTFEEFEDLEGEEALMHIIGEFFPIIKQLSEIEY